jgi:hypothetical protein
VDARLNPVRPFVGSSALGNAQVASGERRCDATMRGG